jgi:uncharacterized protein (DUF2236 family)
MTDAFPPDSVIRRVSREPALLLGAGRALLLQLALPAVAQGVQDHSEFKRNPFKRLQGTLESTYAAVFGSASLADGVGRRIRWVHDFVVGPTYRANDPDHLLWVHATLVDTALRCYSTYVAPLSADEEAEYYRDMTRVAATFGVPVDAQPPTVADFRAYFDEKVASIEVTDVGRDLVGFILRPTLPARLDVPLRPALALQRLLTIGSTPPSLRQQFGVSWSELDQRRFERAERAVRAANRATPRSVRVVPNELAVRVLLRQAARHVREFDARTSGAAASG